MAEAELYLYLRIAAYERICRIQGVEKNRGSKSFPRSQDCFLRIVDQIKYRALASSELSIRNPSWPVKGSIAAKGHRPDAEAISTRIMPEKIPP